MTKPLTNAAAEKAVARRGSTTTTRQIQPQLAEPITVHIPEIDDVGIDAIAKLLVSYALTQTTTTFPEHVLGKSPRLRRTAAITKSAI